MDASCKISKPSKLFKTGEAKLPFIWLSTFFIKQRELGCIFIILINF